MYTFKTESMTSFFLNRNKMDGEFMNTIDLHVHSTISDGTMTPKELVLCKRKGLTPLLLRIMILFLD